ncbi:hypothetical protein JHK82_034976 [Glycine max]|nr:hypothetical protein JHK85_035690 [Glycine max]KAG5111707.1 hypothetical protein JHK82_034976 [Glycine max]
MSQSRTRGSRWSLDLELIAVIGLGNYEDIETKSGTRRLDHVVETRSRIHQAIKDLFCGTQLPKNSSSFLPSLWFLFLIMPLFCELLWEIYSLKSGSWKKLELNMPYCHYCVSRAGVRVYLDEIVIDIMDDDTVLDFRFLRRHLLVLNGSIALVSNYTKAATVCISILGQVGLKKLWTKLFMLGPYPMHQGSCGSQKKGGIFFRKKDDQLVWLILAPRRFRSLVSKEER